MPGVVLVGVAEDHKGEAVWAHGVEGPSLFHEPDVCSVEVG